MRILFSALLLVSCSLHAEVYKWTDANGRTHYGSQASDKNAATVKLEGSSVQSARFSPKVVMYATGWCPYCAKARAYFKSQHIAYSELDIEKNAAAKHAFDQFGVKGVPVILVNKERMQGFEAAQFDALYQQQLALSPP